MHQDIIDGLDYAIEPGVDGSGSRRPYTARHTVAMRHSYARRSRQTGFSAQWMHSGRPAY